MHFIKGVAKWATIWTVLITGCVVVSNVKEGRPTPIFGTLFVAAVCWFVMAALVTFFRLKMVLHTYGEAAGRRLVRGATESDKAVTERALIAGGFKSAPLPQSLPPALPRQ
jgi:hypothetical protein